MARVVTHPPAGGPHPDGSIAGGWWHDAPDGRIVCDLCPRECHLKPGDRGFCFVRENRDGQMVLTTYGRSTGFCVDPIEKKPLNHFFPGTSVLSFGTAGCNLGCKFCQNWSISKSREVQQLSEAATPETIAEAATALGCRSVAYTYNDPVIWAEYAIDSARACHERGIKTVAVTAGYITASARKPFFDAMDAANVDLKAFTEEFYQSLTLSHLQPVLDTLEWLKRETDVWFEITNLVIPQANDDDDEFRRMCDWILDHLGDDVPLHFTAFHPDFRLQDRGATPVETLLSAYELARSKGIKHVYVGNVHDVRHQSTYCPGCGEMVIQRDWYQLGRYDLEENRCLHCSHEISGHFQRRPGDWGRKRLPVRISDYLPKTQILAPTQPIGEVEMNQAQTVTRHGNEDVSRPELTAEQRQAALRAASEIVASSVRSTESNLSDTTLCGAADIPVFGCFVSIKRKGRLRGCCGFLGRRRTVRDALLESAAISAVGDVRMPSVAAVELPFLELEIWLLYGQKAIESKGEERIKEVVTGLHGLQIQRGQARGLLLPGVADEHELNSEGFLQQVCLKAGLPPTAWKDDDVKLASFEGIRIEGSFDPSVAGDQNEAGRMPFSSDALAQLANFCRDNLWALARGAVPNYYLPGGPDGSAHAISLSVTAEGRPEPLQLAQMSIRRPVPVQATLFQMCETAGHQLRSEGAQRLTAQSLEVQVGLLGAPAMHGTVAEPDLDGFDPRYRALMVSQNPKSAWVFDPEKTVEQVLQEAARKACVTQPDASSVTSFLAQANTVPMSVVNVPRPMPGPSARLPAVAGSFYPADAEQLQQVVDKLIPEETVEKHRWRAALVPHAGLMYSGRIAADVFRRIDFPETIIVIGPKHTPLGVEWAVTPHETWQLPGHTLPADPDLATQLCEQIEGLQLDALAHQREHAIEVELPLLARFAPDSKIVGIAIGQGNEGRCQKFAQGLARVLKDRVDRTLLVISSDMNHYANDTETRRVDALAIQAMRDLDPHKLYHTVRDNNISMCGILPAYMILDCLRDLDLLHRAEQVGYGTSADVSGDKSRVVGYAGMLFD